VRLVGHDAFAHAGGTLIPTCSKALWSRSGCIGRTLVGLDAAGDEIRAGLLEDRASSLYDCSKASLPQPSSLAASFHPS
jgi:hypothetical protein